MTPHSHCTLFCTFYLWASVAELHFLFCLCNSNHLLQPNYRIQGANLSLQCQSTALHEFCLVQELGRDAPVKEIFSQWGPSWLNKVTSEEHNSFWIGNLKTKLGSEQRRIEIIFRRLVWDINRSLLYHLKTSESQLPLYEGRNKWKIFKNWLIYIFVSL